MLTAGRQPRPEASVRIKGESEAREAFERAVELGEDWSEGFHLLFAELVLGERQDVLVEPLHEHLNAFRDVVALDSADAVDGLVEPG
jgi:hypothetical protein